MQASGHFKWRAVACVAALLLTSQAWSEERPPKPLSGDLAEIAACVVKGQDAILLPQTVNCHDRYDHKNVPSPDVAVSVNCKDPADRRRLPGDAIKQIAAQTRAAGGGIRIFGAVFCRDELDLRDLELSYSLVLAQSYFRWGITAQNFRTHGDFIADDSLILDNFTLTGAHIDGSLLGRRSFIQDLNISDSEIHGSIILADSLLHGSAQFDRVRLTGDLSIRNAALSFFVAQHATIGGVLDLSDSEARCAYHLKKSQIGALVAVNSGFGTLAGPDANITEPTNYSWRRGEQYTSVKQWRRNAEVDRRVGRAEPCAYPGFGYQAQFYLFDNQVRTSLCVRSFEWIEVNDKWLSLSDSWQKQDEKWHKQNPNKAIPVTVLALNGTTASRNMIFALWPPSPAKGIHDDERLESFHKLEAIGVEAKALIYDFKDASRPYYIFVDGLNIERVHSAVISCDYKAETPQPIDEDRPGDSKGSPAVRQEVIVTSDLQSEVHLPGIKEVEYWLNRNRAYSTQPFVAFTKAFENVGADATDLKVTRAGVDWENEVQQKLDALKSSWRSKSVFRFTWDEGGHALLDFLRFGTTGVLGLIADYGYRPAKVAWTALIIVLVFWYIFRWQLCIVAFKPEKKDEARKLGLLFIFDRLVPVYQIRDDNYEISTFFKDAGPNVPPAQTVVYSGRRYVAATPIESRRAETCLYLLKALGLILAVFLIAAVNALVAH